MKFFFQKRERHNVGTGRRSLGVAVRDPGPADESLRDFRERARRLGRNRRQRNPPRRCYR